MASWWTKLLAGALPLISSVATAETAVADKKKPPNIVFILTDDQDWHMQSLDYMPLLHKHILNEGTLFDRHYCTVAICCPSRVNLWTGRAAHNTNVTDLWPPYGGYPVFVREGLNENWLPVWLQSLGYQTYYTGKLFNAHSVDTYKAPYVKGFNGSDFLLDPYTYEYYHARMTRNGAAPVAYHGQYSPDVVAEKAYGFLDEAVLHDEPFFLGIAPVAPHSNVKVDVSPPQMDQAQYAARHAHLFKDYKIPRTANFNPDVPSGVGWVANLPKLNDTVIEYNDEFQRSRLRALQSVDEMIETVVQKLEAHGILDNTYIFYTTDNGYHISQHRLHPGKECAFETDIHIPLAVRGPGVPSGHVAGVVSSHTDLTPTVLKLAGWERKDLDGLAIPLTKEELNAPESAEHVNVEFWGFAIPEGKYGKFANATLPGQPGLAVNAANNTYKALRVHAKSYNLLYVVWCTGDKEFYDLNLDPDQINNYFNPNAEIPAAAYRLGGRSLKHVINRLDALLMVTKSCKARSCHTPWESLHPNGKIATLKHALDSEYDAFYNEQPKVAFNDCQVGYLLDHEGPQHVNSWVDRIPGGFAQVDQGSQQALHGHWSWWT